MAGDMRTTMRAEFLEIEVGALGKGGGRGFGLLLLVEDAFDAPESCGLLWPTLVATCGSVDRGELN